MLTAQGAAKHMWKETWEKVLTTPEAAKHNKSTIYNDSQRDHQYMDELFELRNEIRKLNRMCNISRMLSIVRELNAKLSVCKNDLDIIEVFSKINYNGRD